MTCKSILISIFAATLMILFIPRISSAYPPVKEGSIEDKLEQGWLDLQKEDYAASLALLNFSSHPKETVRFLQTKLKPLKIDAVRVRELLKALGSDEEKPGSRLSRNYNTSIRIWRSISQL